MQANYTTLARTLDSLTEGETDAVALMATVTAEVFHADDRFDWVGFYRVVADRTLKVGPYQGTHGCLTIPFSQGVCGKCAREKKTQNVPDVAQIGHHIACSGTTRSEIVVPMLSAGGDLVAVLDIDSNTAAAFDKTDEACLPRLSKYLRQKRPGRQ